MVLNFEKSNNQVLTTFANVLLVKCSAPGVITCIMTFFHTKGPFDHKICSGDHQRKLAIIFPLKNSPNWYFKKCVEPRRRIYILTVYTL